MIQYRGHGVSTSRHYYHGRERSDDTPLEFLYRLIVAEIRAKMTIREGTPAMRRENVEHFIETLDERDLFKPLDLL